MTTILYPERMYPDDSEERLIFPADARILMRDTELVSELSEADCAETEGLMIFRQWLSADDLAKFPRLRAVVRMGVGYDRIDRAAAAARGGDGLQRAGLRHDRGGGPCDRVGAGAAAGLAVPSRPAARR